MPCRSRSCGYRRKSFPHVRTCRTKGQQRPGTVNLHRDRSILRRFCDAIRPRQVNADVGQILRFCLQGAPVGHHTQFGRSYSCLHGSPALFFSLAIVADCGDGTGLIDNVFKDSLVFLRLFSAIGMPVDNEFRRFAVRVDCDLGFCLHSRPRTSLPLRLCHATWIRSRSPLRGYTVLRRCRGYGPAPRSAGSTVPRGESFRKCRSRRSRRR